MKKVDFDYESKIWGNTDVRLSPKYLGALRLKYCLDALKSLKGAVLEIGCGAGGMSKAVKFYRPDLMLYGVDISKSAIQAAKNDSQGVEFRVGDAYAVPFKDKLFDAIILFDILEHVESPLLVLKEVRRLLKPNGILHAFIPCEGEPYTLHSISAKLGWRPKKMYAGHIQEFTEENIEIMYKKTGFEVVKKKVDRIFI